MLRNLANAVVHLPGTKQKGKLQGEEGTGNKIAPSSSEDKRANIKQKWSVSRFLFLSVLTYLEGRLCRVIPYAIGRRIVSGFLLSLIENDSSE